MLATLFMQYGIPWLIVAVSGVIGFVVAGFLADVRFFMLALIWIFLFLPLVIAFLYFFYGLDPLTAFNSIPHKILFSGKELKIRILNKENKETEIEKEQQFKDYEVKLQNFKEIKGSGNFVILIFRHEGLLWLPYDAFESLEDIKAITSGLTVHAA